MEFLIKAGIVFAVAFVIVYRIVLLTTKTSQQSDYKSLTNYEKKPEPPSPKSKEKNENEYSINLDVFPNRTDAILFNKSVLIRAYESGNLEQANLSFAKLVESCRQQNIIENGEYDEAYKILVAYYDVFRKTYNLEYPAAYLPPAKKPPKYVLKKRNEKWADLFTAKSSMGAFVTYSESPNGKFTLCWSTRNDSGELYLFEDEKMIYKKKTYISNIGAWVANNGNFIFDKQPFLNQDISRSSLQFYSPSGKLFEKKYNANIFIASISPDGNYVVCQTSNSDNPDGNTLSFFDLSQKQMLWQQKSEIFWTYKIRVDVENRKIWFVDEEYGEFAYSFDGCFIDKEQYQLECRKRAGPWRVCSEAREMIKSLYGTDLEANEKEKILNQVFELTVEAFQKLEGAPVDTNTESWLYRLRGEVAEYRNNLEEAAENYEKALSLNPKVGVKMSLKKVKKKLESSTV